MIHVLMVKTGTCRYRDRHAQKEDNVETEKERHTEIGVTLHRPRMVWGRQKLEETRIFPHRLQRQHGPAHTLILGSWILNC